MVKYTFGRNAEVRETTRLEARLGARGDILHLSLSEPAEPHHQVVIAWTIGEPARPRTQVVGERGSFPCVSFDRSDFDGLIFDEGYTGWVGILDFLQEAEQRPVDRGALKQR